MFNIHSILDVGVIVANDEALDVLFAYNDETQELIMFTGKNNGEYDLSDTRRDVPDNEDDLEEAIASMLDTPDDLTD